MFVYTVTVQTLFILACLRCGTLGVGELAVYYVVGLLMTYAVKRRVSFESRIACGSLRQ